MHEPKMQADTIFQPKSTPECTACQINKAIMAAPRCDPITWMTVLAISSPGVCGVPAVVMESPDSLYFLSGFVAAAGAGVAGFVSAGFVAAAGAGVAGFVSAGFVAAAGASVAGFVSAGFAAGACAGFAAGAGIIIIAQTVIPQLATLFS